MLGFPVRGSCSSVLRDFAVDAVRIQTPMANDMKINSINTSNEYWIVSIQKAKWYNVLSQ